MGLITGYGVGAMVAGRLKRSAIATFAKWWQSFSGFCPTEQKIRPRICGEWDPSHPLPRFRIMPLPGGARQQQADITLCVTSGVYPALGACAKGNGFVR